MTELFIGLDIGGTKFTVAAANAKGEVISRLREKTPLDLEEGLELLNQMVAKLLGTKSPCAIGAAIGGPLEWPEGIVSPLHQPQWRQLPLKKLMEEKWQCPFEVDVDTNVGALAEYEADSTQPARLLYMTISTGIGQGLCLDGELYRGGFNHTHPEIGHQKIIVGTEPVPCDCGAFNCLSAFVCGSGIEKLYGKKAEQLNDREWEEVTDRLGLGLANATLFYAPDVIALGGGVVMGGGEKMLARLNQIVRQEVKIIRPPPIRLSICGHDAPLLGAICLARRASGLKDKSPA